MTKTPYKKITKCDGDLRFFSMQQGFNQRWFASNCEAVYLCYTAEGTAQALDDALASYGGGIKIKSGGHCYEDFVFSDDAKAILDVTPMSETGFDDVRGYYLGSGGTNWSAFKSLFRDFGKVLPSGSCYSVGLGGHISGGGTGILSRLYGMTVDWLSGVEVVVKDQADQPARVIYVSKDSQGDEFDLYWAHTGGGCGNFGIITRYYFADLPDTPQGAIISTISFDWQDLNPIRLGKILDWYVDFASQSDNWHTSGKFQLMHKSAGEMRLLLHSAYYSEDEKNTAKCYQETLREQLKNICKYRIGSSSMAGHASLWAIAPATEAQSSEIGDYSFYEAVQTMNSSGPNQRGKYKSAYVRKRFPPEQIKIMFKHLSSTPPELDPDDMKQSLLQIDTFGGAINKVSPTKTAIAQRSYVVKLQYQTYWLAKQQDCFHLKWIRDFYQDMYKDFGGTPDPAKDPDGLVEGCYYNYPDVDLNNYGGKDGALWLYFLDNFRNNPRNLVKIKGRWDPNNYFHSKQSIPVV